MQDKHREMHQPATGPQEFRATSGRCQSAGWGRGKEEAFLLHLWVYYLHPLSLSFVRSKDEMRQRCADGSTLDQHGSSLEDLLTLSVSVSSLSTGLGGLMKSHPWLVSRLAGTTPWVAWTGTNGLCHLSKHTFQVIQMNWSILLKTMMCSWNMIYLCLPESWGEHMLLFLCS